MQIGGNSTTVTEMINELKKNEEIDIIKVTNNYNILNLASTIFKKKVINSQLLNDYTKNINVLTHIVICIGTTCDSVHLRKKLNMLHEKLFRNILQQKETIKTYFKR